jgi:hypothetical protein
MTKRLHGSSLYYKTDKNIFDALNQHKVDAPTVVRLFQRRNILISKKTSREDLADYFSRLTHDYFDHQEIASRLGVAPRRERITSMDVDGVGETEAILVAAEQLKKSMEATGDVVQVTRNGEDLTLHVHYSTIDYKRNEFSQVQVRDGTVEFVKTAAGYTVRNTQNDFVNNVRETLLGTIGKTSESPVTKVTVSLFDVPSPRLRSKFFYQLMSALPGFVRRDVSDVYVYKARPPAEDKSDDDADEGSDEPATHVERIVLRGNGVTRSALLNELLDEEDYYIVKIGWTATETMGEGNVYDIEADFADIKDCTGFSFILSGVYPLEEGKIASRRRPPLKSEVEAISHAIELKSRELVVKLRNEYAASATEDS